MHNGLYFRPGRDGAPRFCPPSGMAFTWTFFLLVFHLILNEGLYQLRLLFPGSYLHSCDPPIIHGNLTCDTIFIQHNGLIKIGSGLPPAGVLMLLQPAFPAHFVAEISQLCLIFSPQCGIGCSLMVRNRALYCLCIYYSAYSILFRIILSLISVSRCECAWERETTPWWTAESSLFCPRIRRRVLILKLDFVFYTYNKICLTFFYVSSWWRWLCHRYFLLWHLCSWGERTRPVRFPSLIMSVTCDHHTNTIWFAHCRWLYWRSRPTETVLYPKRPSSMQVTLWKTLSWEWVSKIPDVLNTQHHNKDDCSTSLL